VGLTANRSDRASRLATSAPNQPEAQADAGQHAAALPSDQTATAKSRSA